jgi:hypothetical protein
MTLSRVLRTDLGGALAESTDAAGVTDCEMLAERMQQRRRNDHGDTSQNSARDSYRRWSISAWLSREQRALEAEVDPGADARRLAHESNNFFAAGHMQPGKRSDNATSEPRDKLLAETADLWKAAR